MNDGQEKKSGVHGDSCVVVCAPIHNIITIKMPNIIFGGSWEIQNVEDDEERGYRKKMN